MPKTTPQRPLHDVVTLTFRANSTAEPYTLAIKGTEGADVEWSIDQIADRAKKTYRDMVRQNKTGEEYVTFAYNRAVEANAEARNG